MALMIFSFSFDTETKEAAFAGNIEPPLALHLLQDLVISEAMRKARNDGSKSTKQEVRQNEPSRNENSAKNGA